MTGLSGNIIIVSVLYYGGTMVAQSELSIGALTSFLMYAAYSAIAIGGLSSFYTELNKSIGSATRIWEIMDRKYEILNAGIIPSAKTKGLIEFKNVQFSYPSRPNAVILKNLNLTLKNGTRTAIVGKSGKYLIYLLNHLDLSLLALIFRMWKIYDCIIITKVVIINLYNNEVSSFIYN